jgi:hypothetical protein
MEVQTMQLQRHQQLNPLAFAVAAGVTWLLGSLLFGFSMMGMMGGPGMMGAYTHGSAMGLSAMWWIGALLAGFAGAFFAWLYNTVNAKYAGSGADADSRFADTKTS